MQLGVVKAPGQKAKATGPVKGDVPHEASDGGQAEAAPPTTDQSRKRKRKAVDDDGGDLEDGYFRRLHEAETKPKSKKAKAGKKAETIAIGKDEGSGEGDSEGDSDSDDSGDGNGDGAQPDSEDPPTKHESLVLPVDAELDKSKRTVFLGNVPSDVISSKTDYKALKKFFAAAGKIASVRFRSIAFSEQIPRKAAFVNHKLHEKQKTVNAYVVYRDAASARGALKLNGSVVLGRHIRVDSVAHPGKQDPKQCVFVGNLDFEAQEEALWRHFGKCGTVQYVRIVRDSKTNVGKGFAYVQFEVCPSRPGPATGRTDVFVLSQDPMSVEQALLLDGKKMEGDRKLRVTRAKSAGRNAKDRRPAERQQRPKKTDRVYVPKPDPKQQSTIGRATKLLGRAGATALKRQVQVFEGLRATAATDSGIKKGGTGKKKGGKARARTTKRSTAWKRK